MSLHKILLVAALAAAGAAQSYVGDYYTFRLIVNGNSSEWTIHGMWPNWEGAVNRSTCSNASFQLALIEDLLPQMNVDWPSDEEPNQDFWAHEWTKHGVCADNLDEHTYFNTTLLRYAMYNDECPPATANGECSICFLRDLSTRCNCTNDGPGDCPH